MFHVKILCNQTGNALKELSIDSTRLCQFSEFTKHIPLNRRKRRFKSKYKLFRGNRPQICNPVELENVDPDPVFDQICETIPSLKKKQYKLQNFFISNLTQVLQVLPLHHHPQYKEECCKLINSEWARSHTARIRSLEGSKDDLPTCLILLREGKVIGHCRLSKIPSIRKACFAESVVIDKELRGKGYGKHLMLQTEKYCKEYLKFNNIYLCTKGQEDFYAKLGYKECMPISIYGSFNPTNYKPLEMLCKDPTSSNIKIEFNKPITSENISKIKEPPIPPPLPTITPGNQNGKKTYMSKSLEILKWK